MPEPIKLRTSSADGDDYARGLLTCSVGEAVKRFTHEQVEDGTAWKWMDSVVELLNTHSSGSRT